MLAVDHFKGLYSEFVEYHQRALSYIAFLTDGIKSNTYTKEELVDIGFLLREMENLLNDFRKDCKVRKELCGKIIAKKVMEDNLASGDFEDVVHGTLARGIVDLKMQPKIPKRDTEEYQLMMEAFGVPKDKIGIVKIDWTQAGELASKCAAEGVPLPEGLGNTYPVYSTKFTRKGK